MSSSPNRSIVRASVWTPISIGPVSIHSCGVCSPEPLVTPTAIAGMPRACAAFASVLVGGVETGIDASSSACSAARTSG